MNKMNHTSKLYRLFFLIVIFSLMLAACGGSAEEGSQAGDVADVTPADHAEDAGTVDDHEHEEGDEHEEEVDHTTPPTPAALTETGEEGVFIDHHGNRVVDELYQQVEQDGVKVEFTVENFLGVGGRGGEISADLRAGERAVIKFKVSDAATGEALVGLRPAAWLDLHAEDHAELEAEDHEAACKAQVEGYLSGALTERPKVDLNSFFILALNDDPSISVIDPMVDVAGMTQLFALIQLTQPGEDWALSADQERLFVTLPGSNQVAVTEIDGFDVAQHLDAGQNPMRIAFQPDERYLWVGNDAAEPTESGVTAIDPQGLTVVAQIPTGTGQHELAFSSDSRYLYVTNSGDGTLSLIDTQELEQVREVEIGRGPVAVDVSELNGTVYVADAGTGAIVALEGESLEKLAEMQSAPGLVALRFAPGGRWGFAVNPAEDRVYLIDAVENRVTHVVSVEGAPDQVTFSEDAAYVRSTQTAVAQVIPLADLGPESQLQVSSMGVGQVAPGEFPSLPLADAVLAAPEQGAVIAANPADDRIYYFPEGAASPSGSFQGHGLFPRAVQVVDRSLREEAPGVYTGRVRIPASGDYQVALMLNDPLLVHCFEFNAKENPALTASQPALPELTVLSELGQVRVGETFTLEFSLTDGESGEPISGVQDVLALARQTAGNWNQRYIATALGEGRYEMALLLPRAGLYTLYFAVPSLQLNFEQLPQLNLQAAGN